jgi:hypothetical protein
MKQLLKDTISDLVTDFLYYDRKVDDQIGRGDIEKMIESKETSVDEIVEEFKANIERALK